MRSPATPLVARSESAESFCRAAGGVNKRKPRRGFSPMDGGENRTGQTNHATNLSIA